MDIGILRHARKARAFIEWDARINVPDEFLIHPSRQAIKSVSAGLHTLYSCEGIRKLHCVCKFCIYAVGGYKRNLLTSGKANALILSGE